VTSPGLVMNGSYDSRLVALSVGIAVLASIPPLDLAARGTSAPGQAPYLWLGGGATAMGIGMRSMQYVGMIERRHHEESALIILGENIKENLMQRGERASNTGF
jgi:NO-binding membrane sensor protein with MHYT domain